jgi:hypothetical protein
LGYTYRLRTRAVEVETAKIQGMHSIFIEEDTILLALAGATPVPADEIWKTKRLYAGIRPGLSLHSYDTGGTGFANESPKNSVSFDLAAQASWRVFQNFALQAEFIISSDSMSVSPTGVQAYDEYGNFLYAYDTTFTFSSRSLLVPLLAKGIWRPDIFSLSIFGGVYFSLPLGNMKKENSFYGSSQTGSGSFPLGAALGGSAGMKTGPGVLFLDIRYMADLQSAKYQGEAVYKRSVFAFGIGYEMGFY